MGAPNIIYPPSGGGGGGISGSGTAGYLAQFTGSTAIGDSPIRASGTNVAIDMSVSGSYKLSVNGDTTIVGRIDALTGSINTLSSRASNDLVLQRDGVTAATIKAGAIATLTGATPAATNGSYSQLALTGGTGTGATADILVSSGAVSSVTLRAPGNGYTVGDLLTCPTLTGLGVGVTVATVATVIADVEASANVTATGRLAAGTTNPRAGLDVAAGGAIITSSTDFVRTTGFTANSNWRAGLTVSPSIVVAGTANSFNAGIALNPTFDFSGITSTTSGFGVSATATLTASAAGQSANCTGGAFAAQRNNASDLSTVGTYSALQANAAVSSGVGATTTATVYGVNSLAQNSVSGHTVTTLAAVNAQPFAAAGAIVGTGYGVNVTAVATASTWTTYYGLRLQAWSSATVTNRYGISQEDTAAINQFAGTVQFNNGFGSVATVYGTRAWVNFNGTGVVAIRGSGNVSTITDLGVGSYSVNFTNAMPDVNYSAHATVGYDGAVGSGIVASVDRNSAAAAVGSVRVYLFNTTFAVADSTMVFVSVTR